MLKPLAVGAFIYLSAAAGCVANGDLSDPDSNDAESDPAVDPASGATTPSTDFRAAALVHGAFSLTASNKPALAAVYSNPYIAGLAIRVTWDAIEGVEGTYDWSYLDAEVKAASDAGKKVSLYIGANVPQWVYDQGARPFMYLDPNIYHSTYGQPLTIPVPYNQIYLAKWTAFVRAVGAHCASSANSSTIVYVRGASESVTNGWGLPTSDVNGKTWSTYLYTPEKLIGAMTTVLDTFMTAFPGKAEWVEVGTVDFEPDLSGHPATYVAEQITSYGFATYPNRMNVWREDISPCTSINPVPAKWQPLWDHKGRDGAQMVWNVQDGPTRMNKCGISPNDKATVLKAAVQRALDYGMIYVEIYQVDVVDPSVATSMAFAQQNL